MKNLIVANWKMNPANADEATKLADAVTAGVKEMAAEVVLCPPFVFIPQVSPSGNVHIGGQDCFWEDAGAFTGEVSARMLVHFGCSHVILGHSERKNYMGETFGMINKKVRASLDVGLTPVICIGEKTRGEGSENKEELASQMSEVLRDVSPEDAGKLVLAYEPEWAISSNENAQPAHPEDCTAAVEFMRATAHEMFGDDVARQIPILYGGSTNSENIKGFIDAGAAGALVGSVSLDADEFVRLVKNAV